MIKEEYLKLVNGSKIFSALDEESQQKLRSLEGEEMDYYAKLFEEEKRVLNQAWEKCQQNIEQILADFVQEGKMIAIQEMQANESKEKGADEKKLENIINNI